MDNEEEKDFDPNEVEAGDEVFENDDDLDLDLNEEADEDLFSDFTGDETDDNYQDPYNNEGRYDY